MGEWPPPINRLVMGRSNPRPNRHTHTHTHAHAHTRTRTHNLSHVRRNLPYLATCGPRPWTLFLCLFLFLFMCLLLRSFCVGTYSQSVRRSVFENFSIGCRRLANLFDVCNTMLLLYSFRTNKVCCCCLAERPMCETMCLVFISGQTRSLLDVFPT
ncbi:hypothetical protein F4808DRAFT_364985 [Astrocystis sublimbata]|nr:hypothetical protein F4808DRAFT_364985 [Astrocystis sublimbata]